MSICPCRDDAQPHIVENGRCVLCLAECDPVSWNKHAVGCHWTKGNHTISTITDGVRNGYIVVRHPGHVLGEFVTWQEAIRLAEEDE